MNTLWAFLILAGMLILFPFKNLASQEKVMLEGQLDNKYPIKMLIYRDGNTARGNYFYRKVGTLIRLGGTITADGAADLQEWDGSGNQTGSFRGRFASDHSFTGQWISPKGKALSAVLVTSKENDDEFFPSSVENSLTAFSGIQQIQTIRISGGNAQVAHDLNNLLSVSMSGESEDEIRSKFATQEYPQGLVSMNGEVTCNKHHVFSATVTLEVLGAYLSNWTTHINYDLRKGKKLTIGDLLDMEKVGPLVEQLRDEFRRRTLEAIEAASKDGNDLSYLENSVFQDSDLENFSVKEGMGLRFYFNFNLPHVMQVYSPDDSYGIDFEGLGKYIRRDGPLWPLAREWMGF
jgi:hypothetical protein